MCQLCKKKCRESLTIPSNNVIKICCIAEKIIRGCPHILKVQHPIQKMTVIALSHITSDIFDNVLHMLEQAPLQDHRTDIMKLILYIYIFN